MTRRAGIATAVLFLVAIPSAFAADPPQATTEAAKQVGESSVTLAGKVNPKGSSVATCRFEYGTTPAYGAEVPCRPSSLGAGSVNVPVTAEINGLEPGTAYHFRITAASASGATLGTDRSFVTTGTPSCSNADRRREQGILAIRLPDCMALEQVSPSRKWSQRAYVQGISADGARIMFKSQAALADTPGNLDAFQGDVYVATRNPQSVWDTQATSPPAPIDFGIGGRVNMARSFTPDLTRWLVLGGTTEGSQAALGIAQLFRGGLGGLFDPLSPSLVPAGTVNGQQLVSNSRLQGVSADHERVVFAPGDGSATYLPGDPVPSGSGSDRNLYVAELDAAGQPALKLLSRDEVGPDAGKAWGEACGARVGSIAAHGGGATNWRNQGALSHDGTTIYFSTRPKQAEGVPCSSANGLRIMERRIGLDGLADIRHLLPDEGAGECDRIAPACSGVDGDDVYQGASVDGSKVYLITNRQLANSDLDSGSGCSPFVGLTGCDLYLYDAAKPAGERLTQVSAGEVTAQHPVAGEGAGVYLGTVAISGDGSRVYFVAAGVLTDEPNPEGHLASEFPATPKLYHWDASSERTTFVGPLALSDQELWTFAGTFLNRAYPVPATGTDAAGHEVGGDGHVLVFQSRAALTAQDTDGGHLDTFRYDGAASPPSLECVSCRPGGPDGVPIDVSIAQASIEDPGLAGTAFAELGRWVSEDGKTIIVQTTQRLLDEDLNDKRNVYIWRDGSLTLLPGTTLPSSTGAIGLGESIAAVVSHDGSQVAFTAYSPLLPSDGDTAQDVYVARVGGGSPFPPTTEPCQGEQCLPASSGVPGAVAPLSAGYVGRGNVFEPRVRPKRQCPKGKRKARRGKRSVCIKAKKKRRSAKHGRSAKNRGQALKRGGRK